MKDDVIVEAMRHCIHLAKEAVKSDNYPLGSAVVSPDGIVTSTGSVLASGCDPTAHPEIAAIRAAAEKIGSRYLNECVLVSTLEPCPMCTSAAIWAKMTGVAFGTSQLTAINYSRTAPNPKFSFRQIHIRCKQVIEKGDPKLKIFPGILEAECDQLLRLV